MEKSTGKRGVYRKDFVGWAKVAEEVEKRERPKYVKVGGIYWCNLGINIGSCEDGKGNNYTRPVLVLAKMNATQALIVPITSKQKVGANYREICVSAKIEYLLFDQLRMVDTKCLSDLIDDVGDNILKRFRSDLLNILRFRFYKKDEASTQK